MKFGMQVTHVVLSIILDQFDLSSCTRRFYRWSSKLGKIFNYQCRDMKFGMQVTHVVLLIILEKNHLIFLLTQGGFIRDQGG